MKKNFEQKRKLRAVVGLVAMVALLVAMAAMSFTDVKTTQANPPTPCAFVVDPCAPTTTVPTTTVNPCLAAFGGNCPTTPPTTTVNPCPSAFGQCPTTTPPATTTAAPTPAPTPDTGHRIYGKITKDGGVPTAQDKVTVTIGTGDQQLNSDGNYGFNNLQAGTYTVKVKSDVTEKTTKTITLTDTDKDVQFNYELDPTDTVTTTPPAVSTVKYTLKGKVSNQGKGLAGYGISLTGQTVAQHTDNDGNYGFNDLAPGKYKLEVYYELAGVKYPQQDRDVVITTENVTVDFGIGYRIIGSVTGDSAAPATRTLTLYQGTTIVATTTISSEFGGNIPTYSFTTYVAPGTYTLKMSYMNGVCRNVSGSVDVTVINTDTQQNLTLTVGDFVRGAGCPPRR